MLWPEGKVKTTDQSSSKETQATGQRGGLSWWLISKSVSGCCFSLFLAVFPKEVKNSLSSAGHGTVILCSVGNACSPTVLGCWCLFLPYKSLVSWDA